MTTFTRQKLLDTASVSATGNWYPLDWRIDPGGSVRTFTGSLVTGDTVYLELTNEPVDDSAGSPVSVNVIVTASAYTSTIFSGALVGQWSAMRFRKTGVTGPSLVYGVV